MSYREIVEADLRLCILSVAAAAPGYEVNASILRIALEARGHRVSADTLRTQMVWLQEQGLITVQDVGGVLIGRLNQRGLDVAQDRAHVPGVARPEPGLS